MSYDDLINEALVEFQKLIKDTSFNVVLDKEGTVLSEKPMEGSSINCFLCSRLIKAEPAAAAAQIWSWQYNEWLVVSSDLVSWEKKEIDPDTRIVYQVNKLPWPLWSRDTCVVAKKLEKDGAHFLIYKSVDHPDYPENTAQYVRAKVLRSAFIFMKEGDYTRVYRFVQVEPGGVIPSSVVNSLSRSMIDTLDKLQTILK